MAGSTKPWRRRLDVFVVATMAKRALPARNRVSSSLQTRPIVPPYPLALARPSAPTKTTAVRLIEMEGGGKGGKATDHRADHVVWSSHLVYLFTQLASSLLLPSNQSFTSKIGILSGTGDRERYSSILKSGCVK